jgi:hypothetical protein
MHYSGGRQNCGGINFYVPLPSNQKTPKEVLMNTRLKTAALGALVAGSLVFSAGPVLADWNGRHDDHRRSSWNWRHDDHRSDRWRDTRNDRRDLRNDYAELARARRQREYLERTHASRGRIAQEDDHIRSIWNDIRGDRRD